MKKIDFKKLLKEKNVIIGTKRTIKAIKQGRVTKVFLASNCPEDTRKIIEYYSKIGKIEVNHLKMTGEEIGMACKKKFSIAVLSC